MFLIVHRARKEHGLKDTKKLCPIAWFEFEKKNYFVYAQYMN